MYLGEVMLLLNCGAHRGIEHIHQCLSVFQQFAYHTRRKVNADKSYLILKCECTCEQNLLLTCTCMHVKDFAKYLGVKFGEVAPQKAFSHPIQRAMFRTLAMQHWDIALTERLALLELLILPLVSLILGVLFGNNWISQ